jgi:hypothetical protein
MRTDMIRMATWRREILRVQTITKGHGIPCMVGRTISMVVKESMGRLRCFLLLYILLSQGKAEVLILTLQCVATMQTQAIHSLVLCDIVTHPVRLRVLGDVCRCVGALQFFR